MSYDIQIATYQHILETLIENLCGSSGKEKLCDPDGKGKQAILEP